VAVLTAFIYAATFLLARRVRRRLTPAGRPQKPKRGTIPVAVSAAFLKKWWWAIALGGAGFATAGFFPDLREAGPWAILGYAATMFVAIGLGVRLGVKLMIWYEREFQRFTRRGRSHSGS
jgi:hypothetical protein